VNKSDLGARDFLRHIVEACDRVLGYTAGVSEENFLATPIIQDAVMRNIEIIGEATNNLLEVDPQISSRYPSIPFAQIYGMRNRVAHGYFAVNLEMVWDSVEVDVPELRRRIEQVLLDLGGE
jgi:uncharacterized protein with HEPN domain